MLYGRRRGRRSGPHERDRLRRDRWLELVDRERLAAIAERLVEGELVAKVRGLVREVGGGERARLARRDDDLAAHRRAQVDDEVEGAAVLARHLGHAVD